MQISDEELFRAARESAFSWMVPITCEVAVSLYLGSAVPAEVAIKIIATMPEAQEAAKVAAPLGPMLVATESAYRSHCLEIMTRFKNGESLPEATRAEVFMSLLSSLLLGEGMSTKDILVIFALSREILGDTPPIKSGDGRPFDEKAALADLGSAAEAVVQVYIKDMQNHMKVTRTL